jgi:nucleotide-binding universal stress UspA family protein
MKLDRILVAVDGSDNSLAAVVWVAGLAAATGAEVVAVHALGLLDRLDGGEQVPSQANRDEITRRFEDDWCAPLDAAGVRSRRIVRDGNPG